MALQVVSMEELKLEVLLEPERTRESVAEVCARHGISRASFYRYRVGADYPVRHGVPASSE
jgi:hypothetical protein